MVGGQRPGARQGRWLGLIVLAAVAAVAAGGCASPGGAGQPAGATVRLSACTVDSRPARCGYVPVPQDWSHPAGAKLRLQVVVLPASGTTQPGTPLFYLAGSGGQAAGEGDAVLNGLDWAARAFRKLNQTHDLVFVEQRGTPGSGLRTCSGLSDPAVNALEAAVRRCLATARRDPRHDTTTSAVRDLDQVREALGYNKINLYGVSYGVTMGLAYLQRYSDHVRTAVLDSGSLLSVPLEQLVPEHAQQAFDHLVRRCAATPACARHYHPAADLAFILKLLGQNPAQIAVTTQGRTGVVSIPAPAFTSMLVDDWLSWTQSTVWLPEDLHDLALGEWAQVIQRRGLGVGSSAGPTSLQDVTIECSDAWFALNPATVSQQGPSVFAAFTVAQGTWLHALCAHWPHDPGVSGAVHSNVPVVFLNGANDPVNPPANVADATATMPHALLVSVPGTGHWTLNYATHPGCLIADATNFIQAGRPATAAQWAACTRSLGRELMPFPPAP
jgi:pimeloyl-ACP methyl ester carboxylesterase